MIHRGIAIDLRHCLCNCGANRFRLRSGLRRPWHQLDARPAERQTAAWPTFCRGWGRLPFDRSGSDLTAHCESSSLGIHRTVRHRRRWRMADQHGPEHYEQRPTAVGFLIR